LPAKEVDAVSLMIPSLACQRKQKAMHRINAPRTAIAHGS
jgi:hypothetical protein